MTQSSRRLVWSGCSNVRDLGGHATTTGGVTRTGSLIRSNNLARLTVEGRRAVRAGGVSTIIDVRSPFKLGIEANPFAESSEKGGLVYRNLPLIDEADTEGVTLVNAAASVAEAYRLMLDRFGANIGAIMAGIADAPPGAVIIHCHAGKDRTGLIAALALRLSGVSEDLIAEEGLRTQRHLPERFI